ncbi:hypothetical protein H6504_00665 [Candidatus Woesearchaeota archaeon]|nr:hypothetical protein [Candidatus Woesearchaeota archaeon]
MTDLSQLIKGYLKQDVQLVPMRILRELYGAEDEHELLQALGKEDRNHTSHIEVTATDFIRHFGSTIDEQTRYHIIDRIEREAEWDRLYRPDEWSWYEAAQTLLMRAVNKKSKMYGQDGQNTINPLEMSYVLGLSVQSILPRLRNHRMEYMILGVPHFKRSVFMYVVQDLMPEHTQVSKELMRDLNYVLDQTKESGLSPHSHGEVFKQYILWHGRTTPNRVIDDTIEMGNYYIDQESHERPSAPQFRYKKY